MKPIGILGSTGSIGKSTLEVAKNLGDKIEVVGLTANRNIELLAEQVAEFRPRVVAIADEASAKEFREKYSFDCEIRSGQEGLIEVATMAEAEVIVTAIVGSAGLVPTIEAIKARKEIALANKETLVAAGKIVMELADEYSVSILPIDSEHSAIYQALHYRKNHEVGRIIVTASGGPFWELPIEEFENITVDQALNHPTWSMGSKITIDSATMMNKGLEVIEAHWLFDMPLSQIEIIIHPQSIIHSMVEFVDGSIIAQMSQPDMKIPIQYALSYPHHLPASFVENDFCKIQQLNFYEPDFQKFPCLGLAYESAEAGGIMPAILSAVNEMAAKAFLERKIGFLDIPRQIEAVLSEFNNIEEPNLEDILEADQQAREFWRERFG